MLKKIIEKAVRKEVAMKSLTGNISKIIVDTMNREREEKEKAIDEVLKLKEKLEASQRREESLYKQIDDGGKEISELKVKLETSQIREESLYKQIDDDGKEIKDLKEKIIELQKQYLNSHFGFNRDETMKQFVKPFDVDKALKQLEDNQPIVLSDKPQPITWCKFMKQPDGISDNLADEDVNNLPFYTLEYSVDGQEESLINLSLHDCEELYGQIIGSLEYFKMSKQEKFINEISDEYVAYGETFGDNLLYYGVFSSLNNLCNEVLRIPDLKLSKAIRFYKNGKRLAILDIGTLLFTDIDDIRKELFRLEKEIDKND